MNELVTVAAWAAALLLVSAGLAKLRHPSGTVTALRSASLPSHPAVVRLMGLAEVGLGLAVLVAGGRLPVLLLAAAYVAFAAFAGLHRRRPGASCGCFGEATSPLGRRHVVVDGALALVLAGAVITPPPGVAPALGGAVLPALVTVAAVALVAWLLRLHLTDAVALDEAVTLTRGGTP